MARKVHIIKDFDIVFLGFIVSLINSIDLKCGHLDSNVSFFPAQLLFDAFNLTSSLE